MGIELVFNAAQVQPAQALDPIPSGWYVGAVCASERKPTKDNAGSYLELEIEVIDGPYRGRKVYDRLNLENNSPVAVEIAYKTLSAICHATGVIQLQHTDQLNGRPMMVKVVLKQAGVNQQNGQQFDSNNDVKGYKAVDNTAGAAPAGQQAPTPPAQPAWQPPPAAAAPAGAPPWQPPAQAQVAPPQWQPPVQAQPPAQQPPAGWTPPPAQPPAQAAPPAQPQWQPPAQPAQAQPQWQPPAQPAAAAPASPPWAGQPAAGAVAPPWAKK